MILLNPNGFSARLYQHTQSKRLGLSYLNVVITQTLNGSSVCDHRPSWACCNPLCLCGDFGSINFLDCIYHRGVELGYRNLGLSAFDWCDTYPSNACTSNVYFGRLFLQPCSHLLDLRHGIVAERLICCGLWKVNFGHLRKKHGDTLRIPKQPFIGLDSRNSLLQNGQPFHRNLAIGNALLCEYLPLHCEPSGPGCNECKNARQHIPSESNPIRSLDRVSAVYGKRQQNDDYCAQDQAERNKPKRAESRQIRVFHRASLPFQLEFVERIAA